MMRLPALLAREGVQVSFAELIEQPTLEAWWLLIDRRRGQATHLKPVAADNDFALTPLQQAYWFGRDPAMPLGALAVTCIRSWTGIRSTLNAWKAR